MLGWLGFIAKILQFVFDKLFSKKIEQNQDTKTESVKAFVNLYSAVTNLNALTIEFIDLLKPIADGQKTMIYQNWFKYAKMSTYIQRLKKVENELVVSLERIAFILQIYDYPLAILFSSVNEGKKRLYLGASHIFQNTSNNNIFSFDIDLDKKQITYSAAEDDQIKLDIFENELENLNTISSRTLSNFSKIPNRDFLNKIAKEIKKEKTIDFSNTEEIIKFYDILAEHSKLLEKCILSLNEFIRTNFTINDLLYVKMHSH